MAVGTFTITELLQVGATRSEAEVGEVFRWTSDRVPADGVVGGARAAPKRPWTFGGQLRTVRTDYPGAKTPSEQVLGPNHKPFNLFGRWDDRYNFEGYARQEMRRFEAMCFRGHPVRIQFQNQAFEVLIIDWDFPYDREWYIGYTFEVSVHDRPDDLDRSDRSPSTAKSAQEAFNELDELVIAMTEAQDVIPASFLSSDLATTTGTSLGDVIAARDAAAATLDQREFRIDAPSQISPFRRLATQFRTAQNAALQVTQDLLIARSDLDLGVKTALGVLDFEDWMRSQRFFARVAMGQGSRAASDLEERDDPEALALYRPHKGESLYRVSRRFYGTPDAWHLIAERNALSSVTLDGTELLIIPERGTG